MRAFRLAVLATLILVGSGVWALWPAPAPSGPAGTIASDRIEIAVAGSSSMLSFGPAYGLMLGLGLLLLAAGWHLKQRVPEERAA